MARSLAKIKEQIAKLQKEADSIQSSVITRIKKEIAQHGLTSEHLFDSPAAAGTGKAARKAGTTTAKAAAKPKSLDRPAKYSDGEGNSWGGMGKRPQWIHAALVAGRSLEELLVTPGKPAAKAKATRARKATATPSPQKAATKSKSPRAAAKPQAKAPTKPARKTAASLKKAPARKTRSKKAAAASEAIQQVAS